MKILIADTNKTLSKTLAKGLEDGGYYPDVIHNSKELKKNLEKNRYSLVLLDWGFGDENDILETILYIKRNTKKTGVLVISDTEGKDPEIISLNGGSDDYIPKPFTMGELHEKMLEVLLCRMEARLRFGGSNVIEIGDLVIDPDEEKILYKNREIELKGKPFEVLTHLARHRDQIVSKEQLLDAIWEEPELVTPNVIEVAINQIRQKMDKPLKIDTIETVRRRGYRFCFPQKA